MKRVVVVGAGIAGLSVAHALAGFARDEDLDVIMLEASDRTGGNIRTERIEGYLCEWGPNGFLDNVPSTLALARDVGLQAALHPADARAKQRFIFRHGRLHQVPTGPMGFAGTGLLSFRGKLRVTAEPWAQPRPSGDDETIHAFATRRIGREAADVLIDAMVSGVFGGDARRLSLQACFPRMWDLETQYGGLIKALLARRRERRAQKGEAMGAPLGHLTSFREGTEQLTARLTAMLGPRVRTQAPVRALEPRGARYEVVVAGGDRIDADAVVVTSGAATTAGMIRGHDAELAGLLDGIRSAPMVVVCLGYEAHGLPGPLDGFGFLVPRGTGPHILGVLWDSSIYPGRAPEGRVLLRAMLGGAHEPHAIDLPDAQILDVVSRDLQATMGLRAAPSFVRVFRHPVGIPQYQPGHLERLARIDRRLMALPGLFLAGNSYLGVAINSCIAESAGLASRVRAHLSGTRRVD